MENDYPPAPKDDDTEYYGQTHRPHFGAPHKKSKRKLFVVLMMLFVVVLAGASAAAFFLLREPAKPAATANSSKKKSTKSELPAGVQKVGNKYSYKSTKLRIGVTYPLTWSLRESADKQEIILTSPRTAYVKKDGTSAEGVFTLKLRNGIIPEGMKTTVQNAVAVANSEVIAYSQPTGDQRQYTNVSYAGPDANNFGFVFVTGYTEYKAGQIVGGGVDLNGQAYLFAGGYGADAADTLAFEPVPKADFRTATFEDAVHILESLQLF